MRKLLMLSAKESDIVFIQTAQEMGYYVITTGYKRDRIGNKFADKYIPYDYSDYEGIANLVKDQGVSAICQGCTDFCAFTASAVGEKLGLKGHDSFRTSQIIHRKDYFKAFAKRCSVKTPLSVVYTNRDDAINGASKMEYPIIIKPADLAGGAGVRIVYKKSDLIDAIDNAIRKSHIATIVVEQFIEGTLHSMSTFLVNRKVVAFGTANDYSYLNPYLTNTGTFPADNWERAAESLIPEVERIAANLEMVDGLLHLQYIMDANKSPWIIEMMRRSPGNNFTTALSKSTKINWREWIIRAEAGEDCSGIPRVYKPEGYYGYHSIMPSHNGVFVRQIIEQELLRYVTDEYSWMDANRLIDDYLMEKTGNIQMKFDSEQCRDEILQNINTLSRAEVKEK